MTPPRIRVHEISKVLGVTNAEVISVLTRDFNLVIKSHSSTVDQDIADQVIARFKAQKEEKAALSPQPSTPYPGRASGLKPPPGEPIRNEPIIRPSDKEPAALSPQPSTPYPGRASGLKPPPGEPVRNEPIIHPSGRPASASSQPVAPSERRPFSPSPTEQFRGSRPQGSHPRPPLPPGAGQVSDAGRPPVSQGRTTPHSPSSDVRPQQSGPRPPHRPANTSGGGRPGTRHTGRPGMQRGPQRLDSRKQEEEAPAVPKVVSINDSIVVRDLAERLHLRETEIIKHLFMKGMMVTVNQVLDADFAKTVATELGFEVLATETAQRHEGEYNHLNVEARKHLDSNQYLHLKSRSPVVSIMGHVDHGKTTLLDSIRETRHKVVDTEAGGITQSIGAYTVEKDSNRIVFLDTPGHEAFTSMRMRGAKATDIAVLVVAADDGVMPQTIEAVNHAKVAQIPIVVAVNKIDKADADPDRVLAQLSDYGLSAEKWGGDTLTVEVSALQKLGLDDLLDSILLVAELLELKADETVPAEGVVIEAQLDKRTGPIASVLVQNGTLKVGDNILIGSVGGRVRALIDDHGARVHTAGPATPVEVLGLDGVPNAGDPFQVIRNDKLFKRQLTLEKQKDRNQRIGVSRAIAAGFSGKSELESDNASKENQFNLLVKADTQGSLEAVLEVLQRMSSDEIKLNIVHSATGDITEADIMLASTANALIIGFNSKTDANGQRLSDQEGVMIKQYNVIYHITEDIEKWLLGQLAPETEEVLSGTAEVRQIFKVGKTGTIAGCMVTSGKVLRNARASVQRGGKEVYSGILNNLKRFKDDVKEVASGYECGISFDRFQDLQEGDIIEVYTVKALERTSL